MATVHLMTQHRPLAGGEAVVEADGITVGQIIDDLDRPVIADAAFVDFRAALETMSVEEGLQGPDQTFGVDRRRWGEAGHHATSLSLAGAGRRSAMLVAVPATCLSARGRTLRNSVAR